MKYFIICILFFIVFSCTDDAGNEPKKEETISTSASVYILMDTINNSSLQADSAVAVISSSSFNQYYSMTIKQDSTSVNIESIESGNYTVNVSIFENTTKIAFLNTDLVITENQHNTFVFTPTLVKDTITTTNNLLDSFDGNGELIGYITNNALSLPDVTRINGRYRANLTNNSNNVTLHYNEYQGRLDAKLVTFPFEVIARNIGIGTQSDSQTSPLPTNTPYIFAGVQVHVPDLDSRNSSHVVVGHRGGTGYTIEGKNTVDGSSSVNDAGANIVPDGRADIRIVGNSNRTITVYWQTPNLTNAQDNWILYRNSGNLPGTAPTYTDSVYVGLITYAFHSTGVPFVGTCDAFNIYKE